MISAVGFGVLGFRAVAFAESRGEREGTLREYVRRKPGTPRAEYLAHHWKWVLGGVCAALLGAASLAEFVISGFGGEAEGHPIFTSVVAGALLAVITVLVIEALVRSVASRAWHGSLTDTWRGAVRGGRRGASDLLPHLR